VINIELELGDMISDTFETFKKNFMKFFKVSLLVYVIPTIVIQAIIQLSTVSTFMQNMSNPYAGIAAQPTTNPYAALGPKFLLMLFFVLVISLIVNVVYGISLIDVFKRRKGNVDTGSVLSDSFKYFFRVLGLGLLQGFIYLGIILVIVGIPAAAAYFAIGGEMGSGIAALVTLLMIFVAFIPIMYFSIQWVFSQYSMIIDNSGVIDSMKRSKFLVKERWWTMFGYLFVMGLIVGGISMVVSLPVGIVGIFLNMIPVVGPIITTSLSALINAAVTPLSIIFVGLLFERLKEIKSGKKGSDVPIPKPN